MGLNITERFKQMLECACGEWDGESGSAYFPDNQLRKLEDGKRKKRCKSCENPISHGEECLRIARERASRHEIEESIYGDTVPVASWYLCAGCGEVFLNLENAGYCPDPSENQGWLLREHQKSVNHGGWFEFI
jgi:hypothetical protein